MTLQPWLSLAPPISSRAMVILVWIILLRERRKTGKNISVGQPSWMARGKRLTSGWASSKKICGKFGRRSYSAYRETRIIRPHCGSSGNRIRTGRGTADAVMAQAGSDRLGRVEVGVDILRASGYPLSYPSLCVLPRGRPPMTDVQWHCLHSFLITCPDIRVGKETHYGGAPLGGSCRPRTARGTRSIAVLPTGATGASGRVGWPTCRPIRICPRGCWTARSGART